MTAETTQQVTTHAAPPGDAPQGAKFATLLAFEALQKLHADKYATLQSLRWALRVHRQELIECGALCFIAGRLHIDPERFEAAIIAGGRRMAAQRAA